jgi:hypothetical protein
MPFCSQCGTEVELHFCWRCGAPLFQADYELVAEAVDELGRRFIDQYEGLERQIRAAFSDARFAFHEAIGCCKNGNYLASAVMCRETIDGIILLAVLHTVDSQKQPIIDINTLEQFSEKEIPWDQLRQWATDRKYVDQTLLNPIQDIRKLGNFAAHYVEQVMRGVAEAASAPYRVWISPEEAYRSLHIVSQFVMSVIEKWVTTSYGD